MSQPSQEFARRLISLNAKARKLKDFVFWKNIKDAEKELDECRQEQSRLLEFMSKNNIDIEQHYERIKEIVNTLADAEAKLEQDRYNKSFTTRIRRGIVGLIEFLSGLFTNALRMLLPAPVRRLLTGS